MPSSLSISYGQHSVSGTKPVNQDACGVVIPEPFLIASKGIAVALADGISSSQVSQDASAASVNGFLEDYYSTADAWSVKHSASCVLNAINSWLYSQTRQSQYRYHLDKGFVCTFSGIILKSSSAHIVHVGDAQILHLRDQQCLTLTRPHRVQVSSKQHYLQHAMGMSDHLSLDYDRIDIQHGDVFFLMTDGVYEFVSQEELLSFYQRFHDNLDLAAAKITQLALDNGSDDNLTVQIVHIDKVGRQNQRVIFDELSQLPFPPALEPRAELDGYKILEKLHTTARSYVYHAIDIYTGEQVVIKIPAVDIRDNKEHLERFLLEEWIARRINNIHVLKPSQRSRTQHYFYIAHEYINGQTLAQWMIDHPYPSIETVRNIIEQIAKGLQAFHRLEMLHQDLRPENIMIDEHGTVKIIDFGSTKVAGIEEMVGTDRTENILGTAQYTAPEYLLGEYGGEYSDQFSLAVIAYQLLSGKLPYGTKVFKARTRKAQQKLRYASVLNDYTDAPVWVDSALSKALNPNPLKRYGAISEWLHDMRHPNKTFFNETRPPLLERDPVKFWQMVSAILSACLLALLLKR